jgi:hypothetical protein
MPSSAKPLPLRQDEVAAYKDLAARPNPRRFVISFMPALGALLLAAERNKGSALTRSEVRRLLNRAPAIALSAKQVKQLAASRGYADVDPADLYASWLAFKQAALPPQPRQRAARSTSKKNRPAAAPAVERFANILARRIDSPEVVAFLKTWKAKAVVYPKLEAGWIVLHKHGFDVILSLDEVFGKPRGGGKSTIWTYTVRLFSPEYCQGKKIRPYEDELLPGLRFPLTRTSVHQQLGKPVRTHKIRGMDEYLHAGYRVSFVYRREQEQVAFVELEWCQPSS